jgi:hypothetical protein
MNNADLTFVLVGLAFVATMLGRFLARRFDLHFRAIPAYATLPDLAADAVESDKRVHFSLGSSALGDPSTVSALAAAEVVYRMSERLAIGRHMPLVTLSNPVSLPLAQDTLRRAYEYRQNMAHYRVTSAVWYPQGTRSLAFAAGAASLAADADVTSHVLLGQFHYELALIGSGAIRHDQDVIAHSDRVEGQAIAFAYADQVLLGEELYVGPAYLNGTALEKGSVFAQDVLRWLVILGIVVVALQAL